MEPNNDVLDALRIQAAAVAAQQAALTEEELRLQQRRLALEKQERQLASHLDERRRRLLELQDEIKVARAALESERAELIAGLRQEKDEAARERQRLVELRKQQKQRWQDHWQEHEAALKQREAALDAERAQVRKQAEVLAHERTAFEQGRLKRNGELELRRRELQDEGRELALAQQRWEEALNLDHAERRRQEKALAAREAAVVEEERTLAERKRQWEDGGAARKQEIEGLERRIRHLRYQLPLTPALVLPPEAVPFQPEPEVPASLRRLAGDVVDQRWRLLEQWQRLLEVCDAWGKERDGVTGELQRIGLQLHEREQDLAAAERELATYREAAQRQQEALAEQRQRLDGWQARLTIQEAAWQGERATLLAEVQAREEAVAARAQQLEAVRQRRADRLRQEIETLRTAHARCEEMRRQYIVLWQESQDRQTALSQRERELSGRRLALERCRVEWLSRTANPAAAEKRIERLSQKLAARYALAERDLAAEREALTAEAARLDGRAEQLERLQSELDHRSDELAQQETETEVRQLEQTETESRRERELHSLRLRREHDERQLATLRDEIERVARLLLDDAPAALLPRAA